MFVLDILGNQIGKLCATKCDLQLDSIWGWLQKPLKKPQRPWVVAVCLLASLMLERRLSKCDHRLLQTAPWFCCKFLHQFHHYLQRVQAFLNDMQFMNRKLFLTDRHMLYGQYGAVQTVKPLHPTKNITAKQGNILCQYWHAIYELQTLSYGPSRDLQTMWTVQTIMPLHPSKTIRAKKGNILSDDNECS